MASRTNNNELAASLTSPWRTLAILLVGIFMTLLDVSIVNVALPSIQHSLAASGSTLEWIVSGYALALGLLLIPAGRVGDNIGHKWTFLVGLGIFTLFSLLSALSQNQWEIIAARFIQGLGAGIYTPSVVAYVQLLFQGRERSKAFSIYGAVIGIATAIGPLLGGILVQAGGSYWGWRLVFLVNVPVAAILLPLAIKKLPIAKSDRGPHKLDPVGTIGVAVALLLVLFPLVEGQEKGWPWWTWACFALAAVLFTSIWQWSKRLERRRREPLLAVHVLKQPAFSLGALTAVLYFSAFTSIFFLLSLLWQEGLGRDALATGLMIVPFSLANLVGATQSHRLSHRLGYKVLLMGCVLMAIGLVLVLIMLHLGGASLSAWLLTGPLLLAGLGNGVFIAPNQDFSLKAVPPHDAGSASGMFNTAQRVGSSLGIAAVGTTLFGSIDVAKYHSLPLAFIHASEQALRLNIILVIVTLAFVALLVWYHRSSPTTSVDSP